MPLAAWLGIIPALGGAASFAGGALLQHQAARQVDNVGPLRPKLLFELIKIRGFVWSIALSVLGFALQVVSLSVAPLALVQPLLATQVLFYLGIASVLMHKPPDWKMVGAASLVVAGLSGFLLAASPSTGSGKIRGAAVLPLAIGLAVVLVACLLASTRLPETYKVLVLAVATAICYGVTAGLVRSLAVSDLSTLFTQWQLWVVIVIAPAGFLLNQNAFQAGAVGSIAVAIITVGDPVVAILIGALWLGETLQSGVWYVTAQVMALVVMAAGIVILSLRSETVRQRVSSGDSDLPEVL